MLREASALGSSPSVLRVASASGSSPSVLRVVFLHASGSLYDSDQKDNMVAQPNGDKRCPYDWLEMVMRYGARWLYCFVQHRQLYGID